MLVFAFANTNSEAVLGHLHYANSEKVLIDSEQSIDDLVRRIITIQPTTILGMGEYSGRDQDKIRIETVCTNKFRSTPSDLVLESIQIEPFLKATDQMKLAQGMGNSWCNLVSFKVMSIPNMQGRYTFLHIPKGFDTKLAAQIITRQISSIE